MKNVNHGHYFYNILTFSIFGRQEVDCDESETLCVYKRNKQKSVNTVNTIPFGTVI